MLPFLEIRSAGVRSTQSSPVTSKKEIIKFMYTTEKLLPHKFSHMINVNVRSAINILHALHFMCREWMRWCKRSFLAGQKKAGSHLFVRTVVIHKLWIQHTLFKIRSCIGRNWIAINCRTAKWLDIVNHSHITWVYFFSARQRSVVVPLHDTTGSGIRNIALMCDTLACDVSCVCYLISFDPFRWYARTML